MTPDPTAGYPFETLPDYLAGLLGRMTRHGVHVFEGPRGRLKKPPPFAMEEVARRSAEDAVLRATRPDRPEARMRDDLMGQHFDD